MIFRALSTLTALSPLAAVFGLSLLVNLVAVLYQLHALYPMKSYSE